MLSKIIIFLNHDLYCATALNYLTEILQNNEVKICFSQKVGERKKFKELDELEFYENKLPLDIIFPIIENSSVKAKFLTFNQISKQYQIEILEFNDINKDGLKYLKNWKPDLMISIRYGKIFQQEIINLPKYGIINLHSGILPNYRGIMSTFWALLHDEKEIGTTLHLIDDNQIDKGKIIDVNYIKADPDKSLIYQIFSLYQGGCQSIILAINKLKKGEKLKFKEIPQQSESSYYSYPQEPNFKKLKNKYKVFDYKQYYKEVLRNFIEA